MKLRVLPDAEAVARDGADLIAEAARAAVEARGRFVLAVSGGRTPWVMLRGLAGLDLPWPNVHIVQVDERVAPADDPDRNLAHLRQSLLSHAPLPPENIHPMAVEQSDLSAACAAYARCLEDLAGTPPELDLVHLGLGPDGHTASLVPGDSVLEITDSSVGIAGPYQGRQRMTLTYLPINNARRVLFIVTGTEKIDALSKLIRHDRSVPAGRVVAKNAVVVADRSAAAGLVHG